MRADRAGAADDHAAAAGEAVRSPSPPPTPAGAVAAGAVGVASERA